MKKPRSISRGTLARKSREKLLAQRKKQNLSDLATNTRKRRRLARRLIKEQPLFAFEWLSSKIPRYDLSTFNRDTRPTTGRRSKARRILSARIELHNALLEK